MGQAVRIATLIKQIPRFDALELSPDGRLRRDDVELEMNAYCRRAVAKSVELAARFGGECVAFTLGPDSAEDCLREAVAGGASRGVHLCDPQFAGSDSLATARALAAALRLDGQFDLVVAGKNSVDAETGQVGPLIAELLGWPLVSAAKVLDVDPVAGTVTATCETDDGWRSVTSALPAVVTAAERLCDPTKVPPAGRQAVPSSLLRRVTASQLSGGPWGAAGSPTSVGEIRIDDQVRERVMLDGTVSEQATRALDLLAERGLLADDQARTRTPQVPAPRSSEGPRVVVVYVEPGRRELARELLGRAATLAEPFGADVVAIGPLTWSPADLFSWGADRVVELIGSRIEQDVAAAVAGWIADRDAPLLIIPSTVSGREIAGRISARLGIGITGDAVDVTIEGRTAIAWKPAFGGRLVAAIRSDSPVQAVTVRPGALPLPAPRTSGTPVLERLDVAPESSTVVVAEGRDDGAESLGRARVIIAVGTAVQPQDYPLIENLRAVLGGELGATRRVTDKGWLPRARQIGVTGRSVHPRLFVSIGASGRFNHMVGARGSEFVLAINSDPDAPVHDVADVSLVGDWREVVSELLRGLSGLGDTDDGRGGVAAGPAHGSPRSAGAGATVALRSSPGPAIPARAVDTRKRHV